MTDERIKVLVRQRDGFRCVECGITNDEHLAQRGRQLDVHRLEPGSDYTIEGCVTLCRACHGPKPRRRRGSLPIVRIRRDLYRMIRVVAAFRGMSTSEYIDSVLRPIVEHDFYNTIHEEAAKFRRPKPHP